MCPGARRRRAVLPPRKNGNTTMRCAHLTLLLAIVIDEAHGGRVKQALFGSIFGSKSGHTHTDSAVADAEQAELIAFLRSNGFGKYAHKDFIARLDDELAYDSIEDMTHLVADDDYREIDMPHGEAMEIQKLARREMLKRFLASVPLPSGAASDLYSQHLDALIAAGYDEPDDVADLEDDEAKRMDISLEHYRILTGYAEEYETRLLLHVILTTHTDSAGDTPFSSEPVWRPFVDSLVKAGVRSLADLVQLTAANVPTVAKEDLAAVQNDPRVLQHGAKQEL